MHDKLQYCYIVLFLRMAERQSPGWYKQLADGKIERRNHKVGADL